MELLDKLIALLGSFPPFRTNREHQVHSLEHSPLKILPIELIVYIAEFLPLQAAASFTLTCRPVWYILGNQYLDQLNAKGREPDRMAFLELLGRDLPRQILCYDCQLLHSSTKWRYDSRWSSAEQAKCTLKDMGSHVDTYIHEGFSSIAFQSAMKLHRHGLDSSAQLSLLTKSRSLPGYGHTYRWESTPRIVNGHFILRHQLWILFPVRYAVIAPKIISNHVCPHWRFGYWSPSRLDKKIACRVNHWDDLWLNFKCPTCSGLFQCDICPTEFQIDVKNFLKNGVALILTRWLDLGEGRNLSDPRYASHVSHIFDATHYTDTPVEFEAGSIRVAYEGNKFDVEKFLTPRHTFDLFWHTPLPALRGVLPI